MGAISAGGLFRIAVTGYAAAAAGFLAGNIFSALAVPPGKAGERAEGGGIANRRFLGTVLGFTAGLLLAFVCFSMLPEAFAESGLEIGSAGIIAGVAAAFLMEGKAEKMGKWQRASLLMAVVVALHNLPEGMALGSMLNVNPGLGLSMAVIISIHCFPEALAVLTPMRLAGVSRLKVLLFSLALALPMALGAFLGGLLSGANKTFSGVCLGFAGGVMLYMACGDILPESKDIWGGRLSTVGAMAGFLAGVFLTGKML